MISKKKKRRRSIADNTNKGEIETTLNHLRWSVIVARLSQGKRQNDRETNFTICCSDKKGPHTYHLFSSSDDSAMHEI